MVPSRREELVVSLTRRIEDHFEAIDADCGSSVLKPAIDFGDEGRLCPVAVPSQLRHVDVETSGPESVGAIARKVQLGSTEMMFEVAGTCVKGRSVHWRGERSGLLPGEIVVDVAAVGDVDVGIARTEAGEEQVMAVARHIRHEI